MNARVSGTKLQLPWYHFFFCLAMSDTQQVTSALNCWAHEELDMLSGSDRETLSHLLAECDDAAF